MNKFPKHSTNYILVNTKSYFLQRVPNKGRLVVRKCLSLPLAALLWGAFPISCFRITSACSPQPFLPSPAGHWWQWHVTCRCCLTSQWSVLYISMHLLVDCKCLPVIQHFGVLFSWPTASPQTHHRPAPT